MKLVLVAVLVGLCAFASAVEVVLNRHESRKLFVELQALRDARQALDEEWGQLLLEQATWATHVRIETVARDALDMVTPESNKVFELR
ncbi:MAG: cell division protein FtsL [Gammaproteobacteria bacterium]